MKCYKCDKLMKYIQGMDFNEYKVNDWKCTCGVKYMDPDDTQRVLILNKSKNIKSGFKKLSKEIETQFKEAGVSRKDISKAAKWSRGQT